MKNIFKRNKEQAEKNPNPLSIFKAVGDIKTHRKNKDLIMDEINRDMTKITEEQKRKKRQESK